MMRAKRSLGQNFLVGTHFPRRIVEAVAPRAGETIVEIGPGEGAMTGLLIENGSQVIAIELDRELIPLLRERFADRPNLRLVEADALKIDVGQLIAPEITARVVANLPYYISTPILQHLIRYWRYLSEMTIMLQKEVVDRIVAAPGGKEYGYLTVVAQYRYQPEKLFDVPPGAFRPAPKVYSSVVRLRRRDVSAVEKVDEKLFLELTSTLFSQRRKTIFNNLRAGYSRLGLTDDSRITEILSASKIDPKRRAETLTIDEIAVLAGVIIGKRE